ncbi:ribonuclease Z [Fulvivirga sp. M361]|uniref:ribonuclease Z n=1 Tax=Fulvivirga sp. M361 TaxID=2594266 RepID=UPI00117AAFB8|nr:ribonuclease Z [Fulvivirga sp. M361]TRX52439.1 ribonuclease Z [Fulvivirga sp. M361]
MSIRLKILGANSATPAYGRHHTAQLLSTQNQHFLIDCGEGTQERLAKFGVSVLRVNHIFISHLHGDHYLGLMGILFTMHLLRRTADLYVYGQRGLEDIITTQLRYSNSVLNYNLHFRELDPATPQKIFENKTIEVTSFPLEHRIPCCGFLFKEKLKPVRLNKEKLPENLPLASIGQLLKGEDVTDEDGAIIYQNEDLTLPPKKSCSYAFCSDTRYTEKILPYIKNVDLLYHEATFLEEKRPWAETTFHSTTTDAATIAHKAEVNQLVIGHFSARYRDLSPFLEETKKVFSNTLLAYEGEEIKIDDDL